MIPQLPLKQTALIIALACSVLFLASCQTKEDDSIWPDKTVIFGDGTSDSSPVICTLGDLVITQNNLDQRYEELNKEQKSKFADAAGKRLLLRFMVDEALMVQGAYRLELYNDFSVARSYVMQRRNIMQEAMTNIGLLKDKEPTIEEVREYFEVNREEFRRQGKMHVRHIACESKEKADEAWERLQGTDKESSFPYVVRDFSVNTQTKRASGDLGWFNRNGFIPHVLGGKEFSEAVWHFDIGIHEPIKVGPRWHIVEVYEREYGRPQTLDEAYDQVMMRFKPIWQQEVLANFLAESRAQSDIQYFGDYQTGKGLNARELLDRALLISDAQNQLDILDLIISDYEGSDLIDDALFIAGNISLDEWNDRRMSCDYLQKLVDEYPGSEYASDAQYMIDNMYSTDFKAPKSIEDLRK